MTPEQIEEKKRKAAEARARAERLAKQASEAERKAETKRKLLAGAYLFREIEDGRVDRWSSIDDLVKDLDGFLRRKADRAVYGLPPLEDEKPKQPSTEQEPAAPAEPRRRHAPVDLRGSTTPGGGASSA